MRKYDFNRDGNINLMDVTAELRAIAKYSNAYPVVERETGFGITSLATDIEAKSFTVVKMASSIDFDLYRYLGDFNEYYSRMYDAESFQAFTSQNIGIYDKFYTYDEESESYIPYNADLSAYDEEFFEENGLDIKLAIGDPGKRMSVRRIWRDPDGKLSAEFVPRDTDAAIPDGAESGYYQMFLFKLPKNYDSNIRSLYPANDGWQYMGNQ